MKKYLTRLLWVLCILFNTQAMASSCSGICHFLCSPCYCLWGWSDRLMPAVGVDFKGAHLSGKRDWKREFPRYYPMGNAYFAVRFHEYFSLEAGYEQSVRRVRGHAFSAGEQFFGHNLGGFAYNRTVIVRMPHVDLNYLLCVADNLAFIGSLGVGDMRIKSKQVVTQASTDPIGIAVSHLQLKRTLVFRARLGLQWFVTPMFGMRALAGFDNSGHIHVKGSDANLFKNNQIPYRIFKETVSGSIGFFVQF